MTAAFDPTDPTRFEEMYRDERTSHGLPAATPWDIGGPQPVGLEHVGRFPHLVAELMKRGFSEADIGKIASGNALRTMRAVEKAGARLVTGPFPGTDYYVHGDWCPVQTIAQLERQGARRLRSGELEGI